MKQMRKRVPWVGLAVASVLLAGGWVYWANTYGFDPCVPVPAKVSVDGSLTDGGLYRNETKLAVTLAHNGPAVYTVDSVKLRIFQGSTYYRPIAFGRLWPHGTPGVELIRGGGGKGEVDPRLVVSPGHIEFTNTQGKRVVVTY